MWTRDVIVQEFADTYYAAALANADMKIATESLETIRHALLSGQNPFKTWDLFDGQISRVDPDRLQPALIQLRNRFKQQFSKSEISRLHDAFRQNPKTGWTEWLTVYAEALSNWRESFFSALLNEQFAFEPPKDKEAEKIKHGTKLVSHDRWSEACDFFLYLGNHESIPNVQRAKFFVTAGKIHLYHIIGSDRAEEFFLKAEKLAPTEPNVATSWGLYWLNQNEIEKAMDSFQHAVELDPTFPGGYTGMGDCFDKRGDTVEAEEWYQEAIRNASGWTDGYTKLLTLYGTPALFPKHENKLLPLINQSLAVTEDWYPVYLNAGHIYQENKEYREAHRWYDKAIVLDVDRPSGYWNKGIAYLVEEEYDQAIINFQKAIDVAPEAGDGYYGMVIAYERLEKWKEVLHWCEKSLERRPDYEDLARVKIENADWNLGNHDDVKNRLINALNSKPEDETITKLLLQYAERFYRDLNNPEATFQIYTKIREIKGDVYEAEYQNLVGDLKYHYKNYEEAKDAYQKAADTDPYKAIYFSNLAYAWENLEIPGKRILAINNAISALENSINLDHEAYWNRTKLETLQKRKSIITHFGERSLDKQLPVVTPIAAEFAADLIPYIEGSGESSLSLEAATLLSEMRERIENDLGMKVPGFRFRSNEDLPNGTYNLMLNECPVIREQISTHKRLYPGIYRDILHLEIFGDPTLNPLTGRDAFWINEQDWGKIEAANLELWDVIEYPIRHFEKIIRRNLTDFLGHHEVMNKLETSNSDTCNEIQDSTEHLTALVQVLGALVSEEVPIIDFELICEEVKRLYDTGTDTTTIAESIRSMPGIRGELPGNNDEFSFYKLGKHLESLIHQSIHPEGHPPVLDLEPEDCQEILTAVRGDAGSERSVALLVEKAEIRPFVQKLIELEFPQIPVLSQQELLPEFEDKIVGEIELPDFQDSSDTQNSSKYFLGGR